MTKPAVIVTGGAGYIGPHVCKALADERWLPVTIDNLSTGNASAVSHGPFEFGDLGDHTFVDSVFQKYRAKILVHVAASVSVSEASTNPSLYWRNNAVSTLTLIECAIRARCRHIVFTSTGAVYGEAGSSKLRENAITNPINAYGSSKLASEYMLRDFCANDEIRCVVLRLFNVAGADSDVDTSGMLLQRPHLIPTILEQIAIGQTKVQIFGNKHATPDGTCIRDYIHVKDVAASYCRALDLLQSGCAFDTINVGSGLGTSVSNIVSICEKITNVQLSRKVLPPRNGDASAVISNNSLMRTRLKIFQTHTIDDIIFDYWQWCQRISGTQPNDSISQSTNISKF